MKPFDWQQKAVDDSISILKAGDVCVNTSQTGTGKTIVSLAAMTTPFIVIAPLATHTAWLRAATAMGKAELCLGIVNPERLLYKNKYYNRKTKTWTLPQNATVIWDEIHRGASGKDSQTTEALARLKLVGCKVMVMSATIADTPLKMRGVGYLAGLHQWKLESFYPWCRQHGCFSVEFNGRRTLQFTKSKAKAKLHMLGIHSKLKDVMVRIRIAEVPGFPETQVTANLYDLSADYTKEMNEIYEGLSEELHKTHDNPLVARLRARQKSELLKVPLLKDLAEDGIEEGKAVVVFSSFRDTVSELHRLMSDFNPAILIGEQKDRQANIDAFQSNDTPLMLATIGAGGVGVNLHDEHKVRERMSILTPGDSASEFIQALGRIHRSGGTKSVQNVVLIANTIEEKIYEAITLKLGNLEALQDGDLEL